MLTKNQNNFFNLILSTNNKYPLCNSAEEALKYLSFISSEYFGYGTDSNINSIDLERVIYLKIKFQDHDIIQNIIFELEQKIAYSYEYKQKYLARISDNITEPVVKNLVKKRLSTYKRLPLHQNNINREEGKE